MNGSLGQEGFLVALISTYETRIIGPRKENRTYKVLPGDRKKNAVNIEQAMQILKSNESWCWKMLEIQQRILRCINIWLRKITAQDWDQVFMTATPSEENFLHKDL